MRVNRRARTRFGCCIQKNGRFYIELASQLLSAREQAGVPGTGPRDTPHLPGCANHGLRWKDYAQRMNELYGYGVEADGTALKSWGWRTSAR